MDRSTIYTSEQGRSIDFLFAQRATMIGLAKQAQAMFGSGTVVRGLAVTPNSPAALNVLVGIGEIYSMEDVDATAWGSLGADTTDVILKQGLNMSSQTLSTPAPATSGYSINYLIEAQYQDQDTNAAVLPFFNSANPQQPLNGQGGNSAALSTQRQGVCVIQAKAGIAAPTGTQVTPSVDSGWTGIAVVTVAYGQTSVGSGNIAPYAGVPLVTNLLQMMQEGSTNYAIDSSATANTIALLMTPALAAYTDGQEIAFKAANNNTGPCTINAGAGSVNLVGAAGALQGGEIIAGRQYAARYSATLAEFVLSSQSAGALQVPPATASNHAVQLGQLGNAGVVPGRLIATTTFNASGTWTPNAKTTTIRVRMVGGGGGGGGSSACTSAQASAGGGGGSGAYHEFLIANPGAQTVTIGAGGSGGAAGNNAGGNGGTTSFGAIASAGGGSGGGGGPGWTSFPVNAAQGGAAGTVTAVSGTIVASPGNPGHPGIVFGLTSMEGGQGAAALYGGAGAYSNGSAGTAATGAGAGGGGASTSASGAAAAGGAGFRGVVIVEELS